MATESRGQAWQAANMANVAISLMKSSLMHALTDPEDAKMANVMVRTLEHHVSRLRQYLADEQGMTEELEPYFNYATLLSQEIDWIKVIDSAKVIPGDGGCYVEALVWVSDADVSNGEEEQ